MHTTRGHTWSLTIVAISIATVVAALVFWDSPLLLPLKLFVVLLHEISHGLAALLTGGQVEQLVLTRDEGGLAFTRGGNRFLILSAGYLGSALWGVVFMWLAWATPSIRRTALRLTAIALAIVALLYVRNLFGLAYVVTAALVLLALGRHGSARLQMAVLWLIGSFSCLYAVIDIGSDILLGGPLAGIPFLGGGAAASNDAELLARITFIPAFLWGLLWSAIAIALYLFSVFTLALGRGRG
ncbi:MAG: M50 family metallopeptidase [Chloroflexota bacterium]|nr:M50 family metallopeptidase [Chloroflexota bacterium]